MNTPADKLKQAAQRVTEVNEHVRKHAQTVTERHEQERAARKARERENVES